METKYLPAAVLTHALPQLQRAVSMGSPDALAAVKQWGFETIAHVYDPDPIFRPHHYLMKRRAETEWRHMVEEHERRLKAIVLQKSEEAWAAQLNERVIDIQHKGTETRRRDSAGWDKEQRMDEFLTTRPSRRTSRYAWHRRWRRSTVRSPLPNPRHQTPGRKLLASRPRCPASPKISP